METLNKPNPYDHEFSVSFVPHEISVLIELTLGHLRYHLTDVPPQPNSPQDYVFRTNKPTKELTLNPKKKL